MTCKTVHNQAELDAVLAVADGACIHIESERGVWLRVDGKNDHRLELRENSSAELWGNSSAVLWGNSSAELRENSSAVLWGNSSAVLRENSSAVLRENSSAVLWENSSAELRENSSAELRENSSAVLRENSSAELRENSSAVLWENSSAELRGNSSAELWGNSSAELRENSSAELWGAASAHAYDRSKLTATSHVAVHLHSAQAVVEGGVLIDLTQLDLTDPAVWCEHHGVRVADGVAQLYKAVDSELTAGLQYNRPTVYTVGAEVAATDWRSDASCGGGLHVSPHPRMAGSYARATELRFLLVEAPVAELVPLGDDKCKVPSCRVVAEVDARGRVLSAATKEA